jgi:HTH-type transcriptional regulator, sugar sensing transcriptional regulator
MEIVDILKQIGLNEKQASVYLAVLELGTATVHPIATKAGIKRPTTYLILDELQAKGLVSVVPRAKKALYTAESPEKFISDLNKKQELVKRFLPNMMALFNAKIDKPGVLLYEGKTAVREVYENILNAKEVAWFSTISDIISVYPDFPKKLNDVAMSGKVKVRELLTRSSADFDYVKTMRHGENFMQRFATGEGEFFTDNCLYDGNVVFFSFKPSISAIQIKSQGIYKSLKSLYEFAWQAAEDYEKVIKK